MQRKPIWLPECFEEIVLICCLVHTAPRCSHAASTLGHRRIFYLDDVEQRRGVWVFSDPWRAYAFLWHMLIEARSIMLFLLGGSVAHPRKCHVTYCISYRRLYQRQPSISVSYWPIFTKQARCIPSTFSTPSGQSCSHLSSSRSAALVLSNPCYRGFQFG